jgi:hypothetical protein
LVSACLSGIRNISINEDSAHTFHELPSLNHSKNHLALLAWSSNCHDGALESLQAWAITEDGQLLYQRLIQDLRLPKSPAEIALILAALLSFTKLHTGEDTSNEENHLSVICRILAHVVDPSEYVSRHADIDSILVEVMRRRFERTLISAADKYTYSRR